MSDVNKMSRKDFEMLPIREWKEDIGEFDTLVILPSKINPIQVLWYKIRKVVASIFAIGKPELWQIGGLHSSGYRTMDFVAVRGDEPICRLSGCSDVIHIDGIGGYGKYKAGSLPEKIRPKGWSVDCLRKSGLLRLFADGKLSAAEALSSFEIYCKRRENNG